MSMRSAVAASHARDTEVDANVLSQVTYVFKFSICTISFLLFNMSSFNKLCNLNIADFLCIAHCCPYHSDGAY